MYHVAAHVIKNGILNGVCKDSDISNDFYKYDKNKLEDVFDGYAILVAEQEMIDYAIESSLCLNNNVQAYVPDNTAYITNAEKQKFLEWYAKTHK